MATSEAIIEYIKKNGQASGKDLSIYLPNLTTRAIRKQLKNLLEKGILRKIGQPPKVYYLINEVENTKQIIEIDTTIKEIIDERYLYISPTGDIVSGWDGFVLWCSRTKQDVVKTAHEYLKTLEKYDKFKKEGLIDGMNKMRNTFKDVFLDDVFYIDFYSIERFGKTKLGQMLLYAKQSQNTSLIRQLISEIKPQILHVIDLFNIDGVLFVPPTVKREIQFMKELEQFLQLPVRTLEVTKIKTEIIVPQKTLSKLEDRVENAKKTIIVNDTKSYKNILIIDDAVGSGSTLNETAKQIRKRNIVEGKIIGLSITGSFNGFDVISEV